MSTFSLTGAEIKYINEIIVSVQNAAVTDAPDNVLGPAVTFSKTDPFCKTHKYTAVIVSNCSGSVDLKYYFITSITLGQIKAGIGKLQFGLGVSLKWELGQDNTTPGNGQQGSGAGTPTPCTPTADGLGTTGRCYVRYYTTPAQAAVPASGSTPGTPAVPAQTVVFGVVLGDPTKF
jgi:hypothetical protein